MTRYDPDSYESRVALAEALKDALEGWGFVRIDLPRTREQVWARTEEKDLYCRVYTTIDGRQCRAKAKDAIRVCLVYTGDESPRGCGKDRRVHRTGDIEGVVGRTKERVENVTKGIDRCRKCGTPTFRSKAGNNVCAAFCWKEKDEAPKPAPKSNGKTLSEESRKLLAALIDGGDEWWKIVPDKSRRNSALDKLVEFGLIEVDRRIRGCRPTERGYKSYEKAKAHGLVS